MRISYNIFILLILIGAIGCSDQAYKNKLVPTNPRKNETSPYGAYLELSSQETLYKGEYISFSNDTLYLMLLTEVVKFHEQEIDSFNIVLTQTRSKNYLAATLIGMTPALIGAAAHSDYSGEFLTMALITGILGGLATLIESSRKPSVIAYPKDIKEIVLTTKYARFPSGFPEHMTPKSLIIIE